MLAMFAFPALAMFAFPALAILALFIFIIFVLSILISIPSPLSLTVIFRSMIFMRMNICFIRLYRGISIIGLF
ncbi:unnamed protein product [Moneuplotes crassus]|uniref:Uncharacterized protein n=1 Tax=Euplotes crassus TaxID=5936 RepID=A0AAD1Y050_EUPCR|nr:unnamed protein product [Moneuplotes crassus]